MRSWRCRRSSGCAPSARRTRAAPCSAWRCIPGCAACPAASRHCATCCATCVPTAMCTGPRPHAIHAVHHRRATTMNHLEQLSRFAAGSTSPTCPTRCASRPAGSWPTRIAAIVGGSAEPEMQALAGKLAARRRRPPCWPAWGGRGASADVAALLNGTAGTFLEMDEGNRFSRGHPAMHVIPAALALCEQRGGDAHAFLSALVVGYEVGSRIGAASRLRASMHPHGTWGTIGAAAACARAGRPGRRGHARDHQHRRIADHRHVQAHHARRRPGAQCLRRPEQPQRPAGAAAGRSPASPANATAWHR